MRLDFVEMCGFRGFRSLVRMEFGRGFTIVSGRNGVGKSTLFDAIEFAVTGEIDKYRVEKAARESLADYIWWRGSNPAQNHFVRVGFVDSDGRGFVITRSREGGCDKSSDEIERVLCEPAKPDLALRQLCRTAIIRDEWIAEMSLDLSETERFELVRSALGAIEAPAYADKAREVLRSAEEKLRRATAAHEAARSALHAALARLSQARDRASKAGDVAAALAILDTQLGSAPAPVPAIPDRIRMARDHVASNRLRLNRAAEFVRETQQLAALVQEIRDPTHQAVIDRTRQDLEAARIAHEQAQKVVQEAQDALVREQEADSLAAALVGLVEHGSHAGLNDGHCPLCAAARTPQEFEQGMALARQRVEKLGARVEQAKRDMQSARAKAVAPESTYANLQRLLASLLQKDQDYQQREAAQLRAFNNLRLNPAFLLDTAMFQGYLDTEQGKLLDVERAILTLEGSQAVELVTSTERNVSSLRLEVDAAEKTMSRAQVAHAAAKQIDHSVARAGAEIIDERLALISPLLNELYVRLRPHTEWRSIEYNVRGDVRRFLSLKVGDGLNPQFVFSSGQRRAAGLAFLLSVHLSRAWAKWESLLLDDPVQHVDDFRALHLVEVLASLRQQDKQIICAVEDPDLANLLCRRLVSDADTPGIRYDIGHGSDGNTGIVATTRMEPMAVGVFRSVALPRATG